MHFNQIRIQISFTLTSSLTLISEILDQGAEISYQFCLRIARPHSFVYICVSVCAHCVALRILRKFVLKGVTLFNGGFRVQINRKITNNQTYKPIQLMQNKHQKL